MRFISNRVFYLKFFVFLTCLLGVSFSLQAKENFEGVWAKSKAECLDKEGPNFRTNIDLHEKNNGKTLALFDMYEHHCRIVDVKKSKKSVTLSSLCYEFWEDMEKNIDSYKETVKITLNSKNAITMSNTGINKGSAVKYVRCKD
jgi:hypothetical protein